MTFLASRHNPHQDRVPSILQHPLQETSDRWDDWEMQSSVFGLIILFLLNLNWFWNEIAITHIVVQFHKIRSTFAVSSSIRCCSIHSPFCGMPALMLKKGGKMVMALLPKDGIHVVDMDKNVFDYLEVPQKEQLIDAIAKGHIDWIAGSIGICWKHQPDDLLRVVGFVYAGVVAHRKSICSAFEFHRNEKGRQPISQAVECVLHFHALWMLHHCRGFYQVSSLLRWEHQVWKPFLFSQQWGCSSWWSHWWMFLHLEEWYQCGISEIICNSWAILEWHFIWSPSISVVFFIEGFASLWKRTTSLPSLFPEAETIVKKIDRSLVLTLDENPPAVFTNVLHGIEQKVLGYHQKMLSGELSMDMMTTSLTDEQVEYLDKVFS